uniref:Transmembrane protein n=1 Tax=Medicago truncatula TaxID=3880 RepID=I3SJ29_MEDTR|nr:unknown [Medicago truncatula]
MFHHRIGSKSIPRGLFRCRRRMKLCLIHQEGLCMIEIWLEGFILLSMLVNAIIILIR